GLVGPIRSALDELATRHRVHIVAGGVPERSPDPARPFNACVVVSRTGAIGGVYRKVHLFDVQLGDGGSYRESASTSAGDAPLVVELDAARIGLSVCYDLR